MATRKIRLDKDEILKKVSKSIDKIDQKIIDLAHDMLDTMYNSDGIGLAAVQVGFLKRMLVYDIDYVEKDSKKNPHIVINPEITSCSKEMIEVEEGCLSFPDMWGQVSRHRKITVKYLDENGKKITKALTDLEAVVFQHEYDHLNGIVFIDKATNIHMQGKD